jgi:hypothetical protein
MSLLQALDSFERKFVQTLAAVRDIRDDLIAHSTLPELLEMIGHTRDRLVVGIACKEQGDLIRPVNHAVRIHGCNNEP